MPFYIRHLFDILQQIELVAVDVYFSSIVIVMMLCPLVPLGHLLGDRKGIWPENISCCNYNPKGSSLVAQHNLAKLWKTRPVISFVGWVQSPIPAIQNVPIWKTGPTIKVF